MKLPPQSFDVVAVDLKLYADSAVQALQAGEVMAARGGWGLGFRATLAELQTAAEVSGALYAFFRGAAPQEDVFRAFVAALPGNESLIRDFLAGLAATDAADERDRGAA